MGGLADGAQASAIAADVIANRWLALGTSAPTEAVIAANEAVLATPGDERGCTVTALRIFQDQGTIVHAGDSRAYRIRDGIAELLSRDHNLRSELLAAGIVPGSSGRFGPLRALTSYLGKPTAELEFDLRSVALRPGDRLVLCTDGVFGPLENAQFAALAAAGSCTEAAEALTSLGASDDATAVVIDINTDGVRE